LMMVVRLENGGSDTAHAPDAFMPPRPTLCLSGGVYGAKGVEGDPIDSGGR
jgi:hypothetical protein